MPDNQDILSIGFDYKKTQSDADKVIASLQGVLDYSDKLSSIKDILGGATGGFSNSKKASQELTEALKEQNRVALEYNKTLIATANAQAAEAKAAAARIKVEQETVKLLKEEEKAQKENINTKKSALQYQIAIERQKMSGVKSSEAEAKVIAKAADEYYQLGQALKDAETRYKNLYLIGQGQSDAAKQALQQALSIRKVLDTVDQSLGNFQRGVGNYASGFNGLNVSIQQILREAPSAAVSLNTFFLAISNNLPMFFDEISKIKKEQDALNVSTKEAAIIAKEQAIAQALQAGATKEAAIAEGLLAEETLIANAAQKAAPGVLKQIVGSLFSLQSALTLGVLLLTLFGGELFAAVGSMAKSAKAMSNLKKSQDDLKASQEELLKSEQGLKLAQDDLSKSFEGTEFKNAVTQVNSLTENIKLAKEGLLDKTEVLKIYNDTIGETTGKVKTLDEAEAALTKNGDAYIKMTLYKAAANLALEEAAKKTVEAEQTRIKKLQDFEVVADRSNLFNIRSAKELEAANKQIADNEKNRQDEKIKESTLAADTQIAIANKFQKDAAEIATKFNFDFFGTKDKKEKAKKSIEDVIAELRKQLASIQSQFNLGLLTFSDADNERAKAYLKTIEELTKNFKLTDKSSLVIGLAVELNPVSIRIMERQISDFTKKNPIKFDVKAPDYTEAIKIGDSYKEVEIKLYEEIAARQIQIAATQAEDEHINLQNKYAAGLISTEEYNKELLLITTRYAQATLTEQLKAASVAIQNTQLGTKAREDAEKKIRDIQLAFSTEISNKQISNAQKLKDSYKALADDIIGVFGSIITQGYDKEREAIEKSQTLKDAQHAREVENINSSTLNEQEKANRLTQIRAQQDEEKISSQNKEEELDKKKARTERLVQIAIITANAAQSVFKLVAEAAEAKAQAAVLLSNPLTAAYAPIALASAGAITALIPITLASAAIQIAKIPKYAKGLRNNPKDHIGLYGEDGAEIYHEPGKAPVLVDTPTVGLIPKGTNIIPIGSDKINDVMYRNMARQTANALQGNSNVPDKSELLLTDIKNEIRKGNSKSNKFQFNFKHDPSWQGYRNKYYS